MITTLAVLLVAVFFTALLIAISRSWSRWPEPRRAEFIEIGPHGPTTDTEARRRALLSNVIDNHRR